MGFCVNRTTYYSVKITCGRKRVNKPRPGSEQNSRLRTGIEGREGEHKKWTRDGKEI